TLSRRRWKIGDVGRRASWPTAAEIAAALNNAQDRLSAEQFAQLTDLMYLPVRGYVLTASDTEERYALVGSWEGPELAYAQVTMRPLAAVGQRLQLEICPLATDAPGLADQLHALFSEIDPKHAPRTDPSRRSLDRALWIGGSAGETGHDNWEHAVAALLASRGLDVEIFSRPGDATLDAALRRVESFRGAMKLVWEPRAGDAYRRRRLIAAANGNAVVLSEHSFDLVLTEAAIALDERDQDRAQEVRGVGAPAPVAPQPLAGGPHYFKKTGTGGGGYGDRMELMQGPCIHNAFRRARRPDQAKRGIARVAGAEPVRLEHCDSCTGGGFWRAWF
ncbi:MAG: hypothetical protein ACRDKY_03920, partial [Solirubrobacteraceae bacterium]